jgi:hypothetical protein
MESTLMTFLHSNVHDSFICRYWYQDLKAKCCQIFKLYPPSNSFRVAVPECRVTFCTLGLGWPPPPSLLDCHHVYTLIPKIAKCNIIHVYLYFTCYLKSGVPGDLLRSPSHSPNLYPTLTYQPPLVNPHLWASAVGTSRVTSLMGNQYLYTYLYTVPP